MITDPKKAFALAALIAATGIATVELTRSTAQADPVLVTGGPTAYADARIAAAFGTVDEMPAVAPVSVPMAVKGDLPVPPGCVGSDEAECMDVAYELDAEPSLVVETRFGATSTLTRLDPLTVAGVEPEAGQQSE
jgi:hypothetical protein